MSNKSTDIVPGKLYMLSPLYVLMTHNLHYNHHRYNTWALHMCVSPPDGLGVAKLLKPDGLGFVEISDIWLTKETDIVTARLDASCQFIIKPNAINLTGEDELRKNQLMKLVINGYSAPGRHYHNLSHILHCLNMFFELLPCKELSRWKIEEKTAMLLAILFHDIVYNPLSSTNEEESVKTMRKAEMDLGLGRWTATGAQWNAASDFIMATKNHHERFATYRHNSNDSMLTAAMGFFLDIDMSILGSKWEDYSRYASNVRKEYEMYTDEQWTAGRLKFLQTQLTQRNGAIFNSSYFLEKYNAQALENINREVDILRSGSLLQEEMP